VTGPSPVAFPLAHGLPVARGAYGALLLCAPDAAIGLCGPRPASVSARNVARLLGVRHLIQAALTARMPDAMVLAVGSGVDVAHAVSMLALAAASRPLRRAGLADGLVAVSFAVAGAAAAGYAGRRRMRIRMVVPVRPERSSTRSHT
jgi:hypothetical protein